MSVKLDLDTFDYLAKGSSFQVDVLLHKLGSQFNHCSPVVTSSIQDLPYSHSHAAVGTECLGVMSSGRHLNSTPWRPPKKLRWPGEVGHETGAAVTRQGQEQTLER